MVTQRSLQVKAWWLRWVLRKASVEHFPQAFTVSWVMASMGVGVSGPSFPLD